MCHSAIRKNEILSFAGKWMEWETIITYFLSYVKDRSNTNSSIAIYTYKYIWNMFQKVGLLEETKERGKEAKNYGERIIKCITSV
jgi:hypothetical protein